MMVEQKKSVVTGAQYSRSYEGNHGKMYVHAITFENGDSGEYSSKKEDQDKFVIGQEANYEYIPNERNPDYAPKVKPVYEQRGGGGGRGKPANNRAFALAYAKDIAVAIIGQGKDIEEFGGTNGIIAIATKFNLWLEEQDDKPKPEPQKEPEWLHS